MNSDLKKILIVDDDTSLLDTCVERLTGTEIAVETAPFGARTVERICASPYDLVITSIVTPDLYGLILYNDVLKMMPCHMRDRFLFMVGTLHPEARLILSKLLGICMARPFSKKEFMECSNIMAGVRLKKMSRAERRPSKQAPHDRQQDNS